MLSSHSRAQLYQKSLKKVTIFFFILGLTSRGVPPCPLSGSFGWTSTCVLQEIPVARHAPVGGDSGCVICIYILLNIYFVPYMNIADAVGQCAGGRRHRDREALAAGLEAALSGCAGS